MVRAASAFTGIGTAGIIIITGTTIATTGDSTAGG
jgi:hypothetical protein